MTDDCCSSCKDFNDEELDSTSFLTGDNQITYIDSSYRYGFHVKKYPSMIKTFKTIFDNTPLSAMQIYISNSRSKSAPKFDWSDLNAARKILEEKQEIYVCIHACLLYNLAGTVDGPKNVKYKYALNSSIDCLIAELDFGVALGRPSGVGVGVVVHPGSRKNKDEGHEEVSKSITRILTSTLPDITDQVAKNLNITVEEVLQRRKIILENSAGEGTKLCSTLDEISNVIYNVPKHLRNQIKVCIDTAHIYGKGEYDFGVDGEIERFYEEFDEKIGLNHLEVFHFNDSMRSSDKRLNAPFGSRKDRHQNLGAGYIFGGDGDDEESDLKRIDKIVTFIEYARKHHIPMIGEPPNPGILDWMLISYLTKSTDFPLIS